MRDWPAVMQIVTATQMTMRRNLIQPFSFFFGWFSVCLVSAGSAGVSAFAGSGSGSAFGSAGSAGVVGSTGVVGSAVALAGSAAGVATGTAGASPSGFSPIKNSPQFLCLF